MGAGGKIEKQQAEACKNSKRGGYEDFDTLKHNSEGTYKTSFPSSCSTPSPCRNTPALLQPRDNLEGRYVKCPSIVFFNSCESLFASHQRRASYAGKLNKLPFVFKRAVQWRGCGGSSCEANSKHHLHTARLQTCQYVRISIFEAVIPARIKATILLPLDY